MTVNLPSFLRKNINFEFHSDFPIISYPKKKNLLLLFD
jgi:hypothetical protein